MDPAPASKSFFTPKILIIVGIIVIVLSIGLNYLYNRYLQQNATDISQNTADDADPSGQSITVDQDEFTFTAEDQKFSIDYPKGINVKELQKKYYQNSKRFFEGRTEFTPTKRSNDPEYFKLTINTQRIYRDDADRSEQLAHVMTPLRFCPKGNYKKQLHYSVSLNKSTYVFTQNIRGCPSAAYTTYFETFTRAGTFVVEIQSNQPFEKVQKNTNQLLNSLYFDNDL